MTDLKNKASELVYRLYCEDRLDEDEYAPIRDALDEIETVKERDAELERLWAELSDVPMDPETECMEAEFLDFPAGTPREDIWHWFDERHSKGVAYLLYGGDA